MRFRCPRGLPLILACALVLLAVSPAAAREVRFLAPGTQYETPLYIIHGDRPGPVVMVVGGVHGNERAGYEAARRVAEYSINAGTLLVLPEANRPAIAASRRMAPGHYDLNRAFPTASGRVPSRALPREIWAAVREFGVEWLMDLHEALDFYNNPNSNSVGQTIIYYPASARTGQVAEAARNRLNRNISRSLHRFSLLQNPVPGSLARAAGQYLGIHAYIFETSQRLPLSTRINYQLTFVDTVLRELGVR